MTNNCYDDGPPGARADFFPSEPPNPYVNDTPVPQDIAGNLDLNSFRPRAYQNPQTFQIISSGRDRQWGIGGQYISNSPSGRLPFVDQANPSLKGQSLGGVQTIGTECGR